MTDYVSNLGDTSNTPEVSVGGIGRVEIIDNCMVRVTLYRPAGPGECVTVPTMQLLWTLPAWLAARNATQGFADHASKIGAVVTPTIDGDVGVRRH